MQILAIDAWDNDALLEFRLGILKCPFPRGPHSLGRNEHRSHGSIHNNVNHESLINDSLVHSSQKRLYYIGYAHASRKANSSILMFNQCCRFGEGYVLQLVFYYRGLSGEFALASDYFNDVCLRSCSLPKIVFFDSANGINCSHVRFDAQNFESQARAFLDHLIGVVCVLRRDSVRFPLDIRGYVLSEVSARLSRLRRTQTIHTFRAINTDSGPASVKIPVGFTEVTMASTYSSSLAVSQK